MRGEAEHAGFTPDISYRPGDVVCLARHRAKVLQRALGPGLNGGVRNRSPAFGCQSGRRISKTSPNSA